MLIQSVCPRLIVWMMAQGVLRDPRPRTIFRTVEAIPVDRGGRDLAATRGTAGAAGGADPGRVPGRKIETDSRPAAVSDGRSADGDQGGRAGLPGVPRRDAARQDHGPGVPRIRMSPRWRSARRASGIRRQRQRKCCRPPPTNTRKRSNASARYGAGDSRRVDGAKEEC